MKKYLLILGLFFIPFISHGAYINNVTLSDEYGNDIEGTPMNQLKVAETYRLAGSVFINGLPGSSVDPNFWATTTVTNASTTQEYGSVRLQTGTTANASTSIQSVRVARYVGSSANLYRAQVRLPDTGVANNIRRWGAFSLTDGAFYQLSTTTLSVCVRRTSVDTCVAQTSWNGNSFTLGTNVTTYEIYYTNGEIIFSIGGNLVHTYTAATQTWTSTMNLPVRAENGNYNGGTTDTSLFIRVMTISRLGPLLTATTAKNIVGVSSSQILKYGAGVIHRVIIGTPVNNKTVTLYDNTSGTSNPILVITLPNSAIPFSMEMEIPFSTGLNVVPNDTGLNLSIVYE